MNKRLRFKIIENYGSQANFAQKMGVDESVISRVIRGRKSLSPQNVKKWSKALRCDPEILEGQGK